MKKTVYIAPAIFITKMSVENMIAESGLGLSTNSASTEYEMEVKSSSQHVYNVWEDDWSE